MLDADVRSWDGPAASPAGIVCKDYTAAPEKQLMDTTTSHLASIGIDIGKEVFHIVGFSTDGKIAFRRKIKRLALIETFKRLPPSIVGMEACLSAHFVSRALRQLGHEPRIIPAIYVKPFVKGQKNDYNDAEAIAEACLRPNLRTVREKTQDQLDLQACHRVRSRLVSRRTATINQIRAFLIEQGIAVRTGSRALRNSLLAILKDRQDEISPRMGGLIAGLYEDWICLDERIETIASEIEKISEKEANCQRLMSVPGIGPLISTAVVAAIGSGEATATTLAGRRPSSSITQGYLFGHIRAVRTMEIAPTTNSRRR